MIALPEAPERKPFLHQIGRKPHIGGAANAGETVRSLVQDPRFVARQGVDKIGLMGCDQNLRGIPPAGGPRAELMRQASQKLASRLPLV